MCFLLGKRCRYCILICTARNKVMSIIPPHPQGKVLWTDIGPHPSCLSDCCSAVIGCMAIANDKWLCMAMANVIDGAVFADFQLRLLHLTLLEYRNEYMEGLCLFSLLVHTWMCITFLYIHSIGRMEVWVWMNVWTGPLSHNTGSYIFIFSDW